jgi:hypothetical protein
MRESNARTRIRDLRGHARTKMWAGKLRRGTMDAMTTVFEAKSVRCFVSQRSFAITTRRSPFEQSTISCARAQL